MAARAPTVAPRMRGRIAGRRRLVVGDVEDSSGVLGERRVDGLGDVVDMDAVEDLAGFDDPPRITVRDLNERVLARPINAGEPQDCDGNALMRASCCQAFSAANLCWLRPAPGRGGVVSPTHAPLWLP